MRKILSLMMALVMALSLSPMAMAESFTDGTYTGSGKGMMGNIEVSVTVEGGKITAVEVTSQSETAGISDPALETIPQAIVDAQSWEVDAVAGATFTSNGIMEAVKNAITGEGDTAEEPAEIPFEQTDIIVIGAGHGRHDHRCPCCGAGAERPGAGADRQRGRLCHGGRRHPAGLRHQDAGRGRH